MDLAHPYIDRGPHLAAVKRAFDDNGRLLLHGPTGIGKTTIFRQLMREQNRLCLTATPRRAPRPFTTAVELLRAVDGDVIADLPPQWRHILSSLIRGDGEPPGDRVAIQLATLEVFHRMSGHDGILIGIDDAQWMDGESRDIIRFALRNLRPSRLALLLTSDQAALASAVGGNCLPMPVPPWTVSELSELLAGQGLPSRFAGRIHQACGGNPTLAVHIGSVIATPRPTIARTDDFAAFHMAARQLDGLTIRAKRTLLLAALAHRPTVALLRRTGRRHARGDLEMAADAALVTVDHAGVVTFSAGVIADALRADADESTLASGHRALAEAETDPTAALWHQAMADPSPSPELADKLERAGEEVDRAGDPKRAAQLTILAADRTPPTENRARLRRYLAAAAAASFAADSRLTNHAAAAALDLVTVPADRARVQLALIEVAGQALGGIDDVFADAAESAAGHPELLAEVELWRAWRAHICDADLVTAIKHAESALALAVEANVNTPQIEALTTIARLKLALGDASAEELLERAEALYDPKNPVQVNGTASFVRARQALFEDRVVDAREHLSALLPEARRLGRVTGLVEVLRSLAEVELRAGNCRLAQDYATQATRRAAESETSPGAAWYVASLAEAAAGSLDRARLFATQGLRSSREDQDILYTTRNLYALGRVQLMSGDAAAVETLLNVQSLETTNELMDPSVLQWHHELVEALAVNGRVDEAASVLADGRAGAARFERANVSAQLDRAEAVLLLMRGELAEAERLLTRAVTEFEHLGLPLEQGRAMLDLARLEARRPDLDGLDAAINAAAELFRRCGADAWCVVTSVQHERLKSQADGTRLTDAEAKVARLVAGGASNRQTAATLYVSVKTIEATLTRVYRKLGIRSRRQLGMVWRSGRSTT